MGMKEVWNDAPAKSKKRLLSSMGYGGNSGFENVKYEDLPKRSGGMVQRDMNRLYEERQKRKK